MREGGKSGAGAGALEAAGSQPAQVSRFSYCADSLLAVLAMLLLE